jgi:uncharacterized protein (TIGR03437 family)
MFRVLVLVTALSASTASAQIANYVGTAGYSFSNSTQVAPGGLVNFCNVTGIVVQIPYEPLCIPNGQPNDCTIGVPSTVSVAVQVNGIAGQVFYFSLGGGPHFLNSCDSIYGRPSGICNQLTTHADGSLVGPLGWPGVSPAHPGETIIIYAVGLGHSRNSKTGQAVSTPDPLPGPVYLTPATLIGTTLQFGPSIKADWAGLAAGFVGLYQMNVELPTTISSSMPTCNGAEGGNIRLFFGRQVGQDTARTAPFTGVCIATN